MDHPKVVYTAHASATGGRQGRAVTADGTLDLALTVPKEMGGPGGQGTNPEQLLACGYAACFLGAVKAVARRQGLTLSDATTVAAVVGIGQIPTGFALKIDLTVTVPGVDRAVAEKIVADAHLVCPYSNATRNNVAVSLKVA